MVAETPKPVYMGKENPKYPITFCVTTRRLKWADPVVAAFAGLLQASAAVTSTTTAISGVFFTNSVRHWNRFRRALSQPDERHPVPDRRLHADHPLIASHVVVEGLDGRRVIVVR